jgi:hypothetical protein
LVVLRVTKLIFIECMFCLFYLWYYSKLHYCSRITESLLTAVFTFKSVHAHYVSLPLQTRMPKYKGLFCYPCGQLYNSACVSKYIVNRGEDQLFLVPRLSLVVRHFYELVIKCNKQNELFCRNYGDKWIFIIVRLSRSFALILNLLNNFVCHSFYLPFRY